MRVLMFDITLPKAEYWYNFFNILLFIGAFTVAVATYGSIISLPNATFWYNFFNILGAFAVAVGTYGTIKMGAVKEHFADQRISTNEAETARAIADSDIAKAQAAQANERAAEANKKAEEERLARLKLEVRLAPRSLTGAQQQAIVGRIKPFAPQQFEFVSYQEDQEVRGLVETLILILLMAGWRGLPPREMLMGGLVVGVIIEFAPDKTEVFGPAATALAEILTSEGIDAMATANDEITNYPDRIKIKVGKKP